MKKILILGMAAFLFFGFTSWAGAMSAPPEPTYTNSYTTTGAAQLLAVDIDQNLSVTIANSNYAPGYTLQYSLDGTGWSSVPNVIPNNTFIVSTPKGGSRLVQYRLFNIDTSAQITNAVMIFSGIFDDGSKPLYNSVLLLFQFPSPSPFPFPSFNFAFETVSGSNKLSPVPLPGTAWLFGAGLIGFVGILRRKTRG
jgi:hypothetical protein